MMSYEATNHVSPELQETLDKIAGLTGDRKDEFIDLLNSEHPSISRRVEDAYSRCIWWEGCYYCQDENRKWQRVKCFM
ncbi:hypothetical protein ACQ4M4_09850 [Leptolyngbya sp. AN02str]|uniref:hypothetical protein n=1 Tax=Leptolyngbya sp. AN02str TaxID=3423363 RepID=UPI003D31178D